MQRRWARWGAVAVALILPTIASGDARRPRTQDRPRTTQRGGGGEGCGDLIEGVWSSRRYNFAIGRWEVFTLTIRRTAPGAEALSGTIEMHSWLGPIEQVTPACVGLAPRDVIWEETARGTFTGGRVTFAGTSVRMRELRCGGMSVYYLDRFEGALDAARHVITTTNDDGVSEIGVWHEFLRVRCL